MVQILVIANQKGGVGKTTTALNLGAALAEMGHRVLLVDVDPQAGLTASLGIDPYEVRRSTYSLLVHDQMALTSAVVHVGGTLAIIPGSRELASIESRLGTSRDAILRLRRALMQTTLPLDYILIDTPPSLGVLTANGLVAAHKILITVQCQYLAMRGVRTMLETCNHVRASFNPDLQVAGILGTMYRPSSLHSQEVVDELRAVFPQEIFNVLIPDSEALAEAPLAGKSVLTYAPTDPATHAYRTLAQEISAHD
ncbi:ParA family protein [Chloroflexota bacterium]